MSTEKMDQLVSTTATRLSGVAHTLRHLASQAEGGDTHLEGTCHFLADAVEQSVREIDQAAEG